MAFSRPSSPFKPHPHSFKLTFLKLTSAHSTMKQGKRVWPMHCHCNRVTVETGACLLWMFLSMKREFTPPAIKRIWIR